MLDNARVAEHDRMRRYIYIHITIGCNQHIITNGYPTYNSCIDTNPYFIANGRSTFILSSIRLTYNYSFMDITIAAYTCFGVDCNIIGMTEINTPPIWLMALISSPLRFARRRNKVL